MNKSKFLKKSLAAFLAILMVAAMIPLSAAAATVYPGNETIEVTEGSLARETEGDDSSWIVTIPYNGGDSTTITVTSKDAMRYFKVLEDGTPEEFDGASSAVVTVAPTQSATILLRPEDATDETQDITYNFSVKKDATSNDPTVTGAKATYVSGSTGSEVNNTVDGVVEGNTITFAVPWGKLPQDMTFDSAAISTATLELTMAKTPVATDTPAFDPASVSVPLDAKNTGSFTAYAQDKVTSEIYTVKFVEEEALTALNIGGYEAVQDKNDPKAWTVEIPSTEIADTLKVNATAGKTISGISFQQTSCHSNNAASVATTVNGNSYPFATDWKKNSENNDTAPSSNTYSLTLTDDATTPNTTTAYTITVKYLLSKDTSIKNFTATVDGYPETAKIDGKTITLTVPKSADQTKLTAGSFTIAFNAVCKASLNGTALNGGTAAASITVGPGSTGLQMGTGTNVLDVTAEDGTTTDRYWINVVNATATTSDADAAITKAVMKFNGVEYTGVIDTKATPKTVTFTIPASVKKGAASTGTDDVNGGIKDYLADNSTTGATDADVGFTWTATAHTKVDGFASNEADLYKGTLTPGNPDATPATKDSYAFAKAAQGYFATDYATTDTVKYYLLKEGESAPAGAVENTDSFDLATIVNTITVTADGGAAGGVKWNVVFKQDPAKQGHALGSTMTIKVADKEADVTEENTFAATVSNGSTKGVTITDAIPYAMHAGTDTGKFANFEYTVSERAKLYVVKSDDKIYEVPADAFTSTGAHSGDLTIADLTTAKMLVVASEDQWKEWTITDGTTTYKCTTATNNLTVDDTKVTEYPITKTLTPASAAKDIISLTADEGLVSSEVDAAAGTVVLTVPTTYVTAGSETKFDLVAEVSPLVKAVSSFTKGDDGFVMKNAVVKGNADDGYKLYSGANAIASFTVTAENNTTKLFNLTVQAADLDGDNTLNGITVKDVAAEEGEDGWTVELPYGTDLEELTTDDIVADVAESADAAVTKNEDGTYTITVTAENGQKAEYTLTVTVADEPDTPTPVEFEDVKDTDWFAKVVGKAAANKWIMGANGKFNPYGDMKRGDFALIIARIQVEDFDNNCEEFKTDIYTDVTSESYWNEAIGYVTEKGIMGGRGNGIFDPNGTITREEAAKVMCLAKGLDPAEGNTTFTDDASIAGWAKPFVKACQEAGIVNGSNGKFDPKGKLNRAQGANMLVNAFDVEEAE